MHKFYPHIIENGGDLLFITKIKIKLNDLLVTALSIGVKNGVISEICISRRRALHN